MDIVATKTECLPFRRVLAVNATGSSASTLPKTDTVTAPTATTTFLQDATATGWIDLAFNNKGQVVPDAIKVKCYGTGADNTTGEFRLFGISPVYTANSRDPLSYTYTVLAHFSFTLSAAVGVAAGAVVAAERYADTYTRVLGNANISDQLISPAGSSTADYAGHVVVNTKGFRYLFFDLYVGAGSPATDVNALYSWY